MSVLNDRIEASPDDMGARQQLVAQYAVQQQYEQALEQLVNIIDIDPGYADNYAQKAMLRLFNLLGSEHPLVTKFRPTLKRYAH